MSDTNVYPAENTKPLKCFCGKDMQYDQETGVWGCDDSVYVPPDAHFDDKEPRMLTHPFLFLFPALFGLGLLFLTVGLPGFWAPMALGTFYLGRWLELMLRYEGDGW